MQTLRVSLSVSFHVTGTSVAGISRSTNFNGQELNYLKQFNVMAVCMGVYI